MFFIECWRGDFEKELNPTSMLSYYSRIYSLCVIDNQDWFINYISKFWYKWSHQLKWSNQLDTSPLSALVNFNIKNTNQNTPENRHKKQCPDFVHLDTLALHTMSYRWGDRWCYCRAKQIVRTKYCPVVCVSTSRAHGLKILPHIQWCRMHHWTV